MEYVDALQIAVNKSWRSNKDMYRQRGKRISDRGISYLCGSSFPMASDLGTNIRIEKAT